MDIKSIEENLLEYLATWMIKHGFATGHGDTVEDLLDELLGQIKGDYFPEKPTAEMLMAGARHTRASLHDAKEIYKAMRAAYLESKPLKAVDVDHSWIVSSLKQLHGKYQLTDADIEVVDAAASLLSKPCPQEMPTLTD